ncbi:unnamed protein product [Cochlearia groenlandica]
MSQSYGLPSQQINTSPNPSKLNPQHFRNSSYSSEKSNNLFVFSFPQHKTTKDSSYSSDHGDIRRMKYPENCYFSCKQYVNGLICFQESTTTNPIIWNPSLRKFLTLPKPDNSWAYLTLFLGYDPVEGKHKLLYLPSFTSCDECWVLTLGSSGQESWRSVETNHKHYIWSESCEICIIRDKCPTSETQRCREARVVVSTLFPHFLSHNRPELKTRWILTGINDAGELIYVPTTFLGSFSIVYYDPKGNTSRTVEFKGIADEKFRFCNGLGSKRLCLVATIPNHIESLMSL